MTLEAFTRRLARHYDVSESDLEALEAMQCTETSYGPGDTIMARGDVKKSLLLMLDGWSIRSRYTPDGGRQIIQVLLPGDLVTPDAFVVRYNDHAVTALSASRVRSYSRGVMSKILNDLPGLAAGLWWSAAQEEGMLREQIVRLGRRSAIERLSHLLLDLHRRLLIVAKTSEESLQLPMTQTDIADTLGLSPVHINRTLRTLRKMQLIRYEGNVVTLIDQNALAGLCDYDTDHLHLDSSVYASVFHQDEPVDTPGSDPEPVGDPQRAPDTPAEKPPNGPERPAIDTPPGAPNAPHGDAPVGDPPSDEPPKRV